MPGNGFEQRVFLCFCAHVLAGWGQAHNQLLAATQLLVLFILIHSVKTDCIENTVSSSSSIVVLILDCHDVFIEPLSGSEQVLLAPLFQHFLCHVTILYKVWKPLTSGTIITIITMKYEKMIRLTIATTKCINTFCCGDS
jgi:hypothetical protein